MMEHCKEHEDRTICITKMKKDIENFKSNWDMGRKQMSRRAEIIEADIDQKLNTSTFYKIMGLLLCIMVGILGVQWNLLFSIDENSHRMSLNQVVIMEKVENIEENM